MSAASGPYGRVAPVSPPLKGSFPLDYGRKCHLEMLDYMYCLHDKQFKNDNCRDLACNYFRCRMNHGLMDKDEWTRLGYKDKEKITLKPSNS